MFRIVMVVLFSMTPKLRILLMKKSKKHGKSFWQPVTGLVELRDSSLEEAAFREVREETRLRAMGKLIDLQYQFGFKRHSSLHVEHCFGLEVEYRAPELGEEHTEYIWADYDTAIKMLDWGEEREAVRRLIKAIRSG